jgi:hypothetical protein
LVVTTAAVPVWTFWSPLEYPSVKAPTGTVMLKALPLLESVPVAVLQMIEKFYASTLSAEMNVSLLHSKRK